MHERTYVYTQRTVLAYFMMMHHDQLLTSIEGPTGSDTSFVVVLLLVLLLTIASETPVQAQDLVSQSLPP